MGKRLPDGRQTYQQALVMPVVLPPDPWCAGFLVDDRAPGLVLQDAAVIVRGLVVDDFAEVEAHGEPLANRDPSS